MLGVLAAMLMQGAELSSPPPPSSLPPGARPSVITQPDWAAKPAMPDLVSVYPKQALLAGIEGHATISCSVGAEGGLHECRVVAEDPADQGFGEAAVKMSVFFRMLPMTKDGHPVSGGTIRIPVHFQAPPPPAIPAGPPPPGGPVVRPDWLRKPTGGDVVRVYPAAARQTKLEGRGAVKCQVTSEGRLAECLIVSEAPVGQDFGAAAMRLAPLFRMRDVDGFGEKVAGRSITIPVAFRLPK